MADIATISLRADTSSLEQGDKALDHFGQTAEKATKQADGLNDAFKAGAQSQKQNNESLKQQQQALQDLLAKINPVNNALNKLDDMQLQLSKFRSQGIVDDRTYRESAVAIGRARQELTAAAEASTKAGRAAAEQAAADRAATTAKENFITRLREQTELQGKTASQVQEYKAAQLGMTQQAAPFIAKLKEQEDAWKKGTVSAGQYRMAMRQLPMQFTDIATSIAGGMPLYMIAIQQGGQIKDSFGGIGNASKALLSLITPMTVGLVGAAAVVGGLALAYYKGAAENEEFNKQLILTGNYAGRTASQLQAMAKGLSGNGLTQSALSSAMAKVVGTGSFDSSQIEMVTLAAAKMEQATGQSIDATVNNFKRLQDEPLKAAKELDDQLHYLTASEYEQISAMERSGNTIGAARVAMESYAKAMRDRSSDVRENLGSLEKAWRLLSETASGAWDSMLNIGREKPLSAKLEDTRKQLEQAEKDLSNMKKGGPVDSSGYGYGRQSESLGSQQASQQFEAQKSLVSRLQKQMGVLSEQSYQEGIAASRSKADQDEQTRLKNNIQDREDLESKYADRSAQRNKELKYLESKRSLLSVEEYERYKTEIEKKYADRKTAQPKAYQDDAATKALLDSQARVAALREQATVTLTMTDQEKQLAKFTQQIADLKSKTILTADQKSLLARSGEITASMQLEAQLSRENVERKKATEALKKMEEYTASIAAKNKQNQDRFGLTSKQAGRVDQEAQLDNTFRKDTKGINDAEQLAKITTEYNKAKAELHAGFEQEDLNEGDWLAGMTQGLEQYGETANNVFSATAQLAQTTMGSMTSMATQMMTTGSANVKQFATNFLTSIVDIINRLLIAQAIQAAMGWMSGGASAGAGAVGGAASSASTGAMGMSTSFRAYDVGGYTGDGGKFEPKGVVHGGEFVFTKEATNRIGIDNLYKMMRGYADGGLVSNAVTATAPMLGMQGGGTAISVDLRGMTITTQGNQQQDSGANNGELVSKAARNEVIAIVTQQLDRAMGQSGRITNFVANKTGR